MATLVMLCAHPVDAVFDTGPARKAVEDGHRVVQVSATKGEWGGELPEIGLAGADLAERRAGELRASAGLLGVARVEFLGYGDSGPGEPAAGGFAAAEVEDAAEGLAALLREERADVLVMPADGGVTGHPDHLQAHRVGLRAAELAGTARVFQATLNKDYMDFGIQALVDQAEEEGLSLPGLAALPSLGRPEPEITAAIDVARHVDWIRWVLRLHTSHFGDDSPLLCAPDVVFRLLFSTAWYIRAGQGPGITETDFVAGL
jgi:LmbE family N-acetylglucosaminyl deacetylase